MDHQIVTLGVLDWIGLVPRDIGMAVIGGCIVGLLPFLWRALKETYDWARAKIGGDSIKIKQERDQMQQAYEELLEKFAKTIKEQMLPSKVRVVRDGNGIVQKTELVYPDVQPQQKEFVPDVADNQDNVVEGDAELVDDDNVYYDPSTGDEVVSSSTASNEEPIIEEQVVRPRQNVTSRPGRRISSRPPRLPKR